jgi:hypothetical protein
MHYIAMQISLTFAGEGILLQPNAWFLMRCQKNAGGRRIARWIHSEIGMVIGRRPSGNTSQNPFASIFHPVHRSGFHTYLSAGRWLK